MIKLTALFATFGMLGQLTAQVVIESPIVGYDLTSITAATGADGPGISFKASEYLRSVERTGIATVIGTDSITDAWATWADDLYNGGSGSHYLEILSVNGSTTAPGVGTTRTILATSEFEKKVTFSAPLPPGLVAPLAYRIVKHWTIAALFGATNQAGLKGGTAISADLIQFWDAGNYASFYYQTAGIGGTGWRKSGDQTTDASARIIPVEQAIMIKRSELTPLTLFLHGQSKSGITPLTVAPGFNFVPNPYAAPMTLTSCGIYTGNASTGIAGGNLVTADQVMVWNGTIYQLYYYQKSGVGGVGWRQAGDLTTDAGSTSIPAGSSLIVRRLGAAGFVWNVPPHPAA